MSDQPVFIPGRPNRKLLAMVAELADLRRQGFSIADIHRYLATRGITVDYATVRSEVRKLEKGTVTKVPSPVATAPAPATGTAPPATAVEGSKGTGKSKTDEFFDSYTPPNPILERLDRLRNKKP